MLIQMPVFVALYGVLRGAIELRQAPFMFWINDLSAPDLLFRLGTLPLLPDEVHVLPIVMAGTTILMQKTTMMSSTGSQKIMMYMMLLSYERLDWCNRNQERNGFNFPKHTLLDITYLKELCTNSGMF